MNAQTKPTRRRAVYIAAVDRDKANPFEPESDGNYSRGFASDIPESTAERDASNDLRLSDDVPPHFGTI